MATIVSSGTTAAIRCFFGGSPSVLNWTSRVCTRLLLAQTWETPCWAFQSDTEDRIWQSRASLLPYPSFYGSSLLPIPCLTLSQNHSTPASDAGSLTRLSFLGLQKCLVAHLHPVVALQRFRPGSLVCKCDSKGNATLSRMEWNHFQVSWYITVKPSFLDGASV